jgi:hypothetical protein
MNSKVHVVCQKKKFSPWSQIPLKYLIDSVRCHVCANKRTTRATLKNYKKIQIKNYFKQIEKKKRRKNERGCCRFLLGPQATPKGGWGWRATTPSLI